MIDHYISTISADGNNQKKIRFRTQVCEKCNYNVINHGHTSQNTFYVIVYTLSMFQRWVWTLLWVKARLCPHKSGIRIQIIRYVPTPRAFAHRRTHIPTKCTRFHIMLIKIEIYHQTSYISSNLLGNEFAGHSDADGASSVGAPPTTVSIST